MDGFNKYLNELNPLFPLKGMMVAGGCVRDYLDSKKDSRDIDIYFKNKEDLDNAIEIIKLPVKTNNSYIIVYEHLPEIQVVRYYTLQPQELLKKLDFTIGRIIYDCDEDKFYKDEDYDKDLQLKKLVFRYSEFPIQSFKRLVKYLNKGFTISDIEIINMAKVITKKYGI